MSFGNIILQIHTDQADVHTFRRGDEIEVEVYDKPLAWMFISNNL